MLRGAGQADGQGLVGEGDGAFAVQPALRRIHHEGSGAAATVLDVEADDHAAERRPRFLVGQQGTAGIEAERLGDFGRQGALTRDDADPSGRSADGLADRAAAPDQQRAAIDAAGDRSAAAAERGNAAVGEPEIDTDQRYRAIIPLVDHGAAGDPALAQADRERCDGQHAMVERQRAGEAGQRGRAVAADDALDAKGDPAVRAADLSEVHARVGNDTGAERALLRGGFRQPFVRGEIVEIELAGHEDAVELGSAIHLVHGQLAGQVGSSDPAVQPVDQPSPGLATDVGRQAHRLGAKQARLDDRVDQLQVAGRGGDVEGHVVGVERRRHAPGGVHGEPVPGDPGIKRPGPGALIGDRRRARRQANGRSTHAAGAAKPQPGRHIRFERQVEPAILLLVAIGEPGVADGQPVEPAAAGPAAPCAATPVLAPVTRTHEVELRAAEHDVIQRQPSRHQRQGAEADLHPLDPRQVPRTGPGRAGNAHVAQPDGGGEAEAIDALHGADRHRSPEALGHALFDDTLEQSPGKRRQRDRQRRDQKGYGRGRDAEAAIGERGDHHSRDAHGKGSFRLRKG